MAFSSSTFKERKILLYSIFLSWDKLFLVRETTYVIFDIDIESVMDVPSGTFIHKTRNISIEKTFQRDKLTNLSIDPFAKMNSLGINHEVLISP